MGPERKILRARPKRILVICAMPYRPPWREGVSNLARRLVDFLIQRQFEVTVLSPETRGGSTSILAGEFGETIVNVNCGAPRAWIGRLRFWTKMLLKVRELKCEIDAIFLFASASMTLGIKTRLIKLFGTRPLIVYITALGDPRVFVNRLIFADRVLIISTFLQKWFPHAEIVFPFLPINFASSTWKGSRTQRNELFHFLFMGALERERGIEDMLESFSIAIRRGKRPMFLTLAWNGYGSYTLDYIYNLLSILKISKNVQISKIVDTEDAYRRCHVVVIPHIRETRMAFPVRIVEALYMAKPLIVTDACGMGDLIRGCGLAVKRGDVKAMAAAMIQLADETDTYRRCVRNCSSRRKEYNSLSSLNQLHRTIEEVVS